MTSRRDIAASPTIVPHQDIDNMSIDQLTELINYAKQIRERKLTAARLALIKETRAKVAALGIDIDAFIAMIPSTEDISSSQDKSVKSVPAKYRGPNGEEWSGRGKIPRWLASLERDGRKRDDFRVSP